MKLVTFKTDKSTVYEQTIDLFTQLKPYLDNTIRTWIKVKDIDNNYQDFVKGRKEIFEQCGLTKDTHFLASTCVGGLENQAQLVTLSALISNDLKSLNPIYMENTDVMPHTHTYGVTFERGIRIEVGEYYFYYISGTASIRADGNIAYKGDLFSQLNRAIFNVDMLLKKYGAKLKDIYKAIVYVRNEKDMFQVKRFISNHPSFKSKELKFDHAPICRPDWLVEIEVTAKRIK